MRRWLTYVHLVPTPTTHTSPPPLPRPYSTGVIVALFHAGEEAFYAHTRWAAEACWMDDEVGSLRCVCFRCCRCRICCWFDVHTGRRARGGSARQEANGGASESNTGI